MANPIEIDDDSDTAVSRLEAEVARRRERLSNTLSDLRTELHEVREWRHWYERYPVGFLVGAMVVGFATGRVLSSR